MSEQPTTSALRLAADDVEALRRARDVLRLQLEASEPWRALRQLDEREARGDSVRSLDGQALRCFLETTLDKSCPGWRALSALGEAIEASDRWHRPVVVAPIVVLPPDSPRVVEPVTSAVSPIPEPAPPPAPTQVVAAVPEPPPETIAATPESLPAASPPRSQPTDLRRIRLIGRIADPSPPAEAPKTDRFGGIVPWARFGEPPPVPVEAPPVAAEPAVVHAPKLAAPRDWQDATARAVSSTTPAAPVDPVNVRAEPPPTQLSEPSPTPAAEAADIEIDTDPPPVAVGLPAAGSQPARADLTGMERLERLEADLDEIVGDGISAASRRGKRTGHDDDEAVLGVEEAEVVIVPVRPELAAPEPAPRDLVTSPPVALSIRLKETERQEEFDGADYAAYRDDVEEAEVEIIRHGDDKRRSALPSVPEPVPPLPPKSGAPRRFLKVLSGE